MMDLRKNGIIKLNALMVLCVLIISLTGCTEESNDADLSQYENKKFKQFVKELDTPEKLSNFMEQYFSIEERGGCNAYPPQQFFELKKGDCKDYSAFSSFVLSYHGYDAEMLCFDLYNSKGVRTSGHVVTVFKVDGSMYYMSLYQIKSASSIQEILKEERDRLGYAKVGKHETVPAGSTSVCPQYEPKGRD